MEFSIEKKYQNLITDSAKAYAIRDQNLISARVINIDIKKNKGHVTYSKTTEPYRQARLKISKRSLKRQTNFWAA